MFRNFYWLIFLLPLGLGAQPKIQLISFSTGFSNPVDIAHAGDDRLFVVEQVGRIKVIDTAGALLSPHFLKIEDRVLFGGERGLLGLAFDPNYATNGHFYVNYTRKPDGHTRISRFTVRPNDPDAADSLSEEILMTITQPYANHNGGGMKFGPDGYLYISMGDGGSGGDPQNNGQKTSTLLGKILRIDVNGPDSLYNVPDDNPFVGNTAYRPEIWSLGWRNPWRFSFDRLTGDMWIADVGQNQLEEIDFEPAGTGGLNYGWRCYEASDPYNTAGCQPASEFVFPVFEYDHGMFGGCSVTGGFVYRGTRYSDLYGAYLLTDYCSGRWWTVRRQTDGSFSGELIADLTNNQYTALGENIHGELFVTGHGNGVIYRIHELCSSFQVNAGLSHNPCDSMAGGAIDLAVTGGEQPVSFSWSTGAVSEDLSGLPAGIYQVEATDGNDCRRTLSVEIENRIPETPVISLVSGDTLLCSGDTTMLEATPAPAGAAYQWYKGENAIPGATGSQLTVTEGGIYTVRYTRDSCRSAASAIFSIFYFDPALPEITLASGQSTLCPGDFAVLQASAAPPGYTYQWLAGNMPISGATGQELTVTEFGYYQVQFIGACPIGPSDSFLIEQEVVIPPFIIHNGDTLSGPPNWASYQWYFNGEPIPNGNVETIIATQSGFYEIEVTSANGCVYRYGTDITVTSGLLPASVTRFGLSPNPTSGQIALTLRLARTERLTLTLTDSSRRQLFRQSHQVQELDKVIDLEHLPAGTYFLNVELESGRFVRTIVKR